jgi:carboxypeptidase-like protein
MNFPKLLQYGLVVVVLALTDQAVMGQVLIKGTVYDRSQFHTMQGVSVVGTSGIGTTTDSVGKYSIRLSIDDSISFSYLGKSTYKFPVKNIPNTSELDMSLDVNVDTLASVYVRPKNYYLDSLENRQEYQKIFDYDGPGGLENAKMGRGRGMGVGIDFDMLFDGKRNRRMLAFQKRLVEEEQDKYVDHRWTRYVVKRVTGLQAPALDTFMRQYRPSYDFVKSFETDWEFYEYILSSGRFFAQVWNQDHPDLPAFAPKLVIEGISDSTGRAGSDSTVSRQSN